jgi:glycosyltransferase involved in cell wall biosynthesis
VVSAISGLGFLFVKRESMFANIFRFCTLLLYRLAMGHKNQKVIFQNTSDEKALIDSGGVSSHKSVLIKGSGVYLDEYPYNKIIHNPPVIVMASRLLRDKGVIEFIEAARRIKKYNKNVIFRLVGQIDSENPESVTEHELQLWKNEGIVEILGYRMDIADIFTNASIVVLPSYYGEGLPKVLIEAAASGRAVVTTDMPGCRDSIIEGLTGLLIPPKDVDALVDSLDLLINDTELCVKLGEQGRKLAEAEYDLFSVIRKHLALYDELLTG